MRIFLLLIAVLLCFGVCALSFLFLANKLSKLRYTVFSSGVSIFAILALFHMLYLYWEKRHQH